jgi:multidrug efflux pump subunit AcrA (membrane-fusion protein)
MNAEVEVIAAEARDALLVPLQALRELAPGSYAVFVVQPDGELEMRVVQIGLQDFVNAEVLSGLAPGEVVSLGEIVSPDTSAVAGDEPPPGGPMGGIGGLLGGGR